MSILLTLVTFLLFITVAYLLGTQRQPAEGRAGVSAPKPRITSEPGLSIPKDYIFHPGHTWALVEGPHRARIGLDHFGANLIGKVDRVEVAGLNRWVRQGQKVAQVISGSQAVDLVAPVEGVVTAVNLNLRGDPGAVSRDPYGEGWLLQVQSPDLPVNLKNLLQGNLVRAWMRNALERTATLAAGVSPALAQDGGTPVPGLLAQVAPEIRQAMVQEFFLT